MLLLVELVTSHKFTSHRWQSSQNFSCKQFVSMLKASTIWMERIAVSINHNKVKEHKISNNDLPKSLTIYESFCTMNNKETSIFS